MAEELKIKFPTPEKILSRMREIDEIFGRERDGEELAIRLLYVREALTRVWNEQSFLISQSLTVWFEARELYDLLSYDAKRHLKRGDLDYTN